MMRIDMSSTIDIVIPTFNRSAAVKWLVESLTPFLDFGDTVTVVWQGLEKPDINESKIVSLIHSSPPNLPRARNLGIEKTGGEIILFLDDDVEMVSNILQYHRKAYEDKLVGAVTGYIDDPLFQTQSDGLPRFDNQTGELIQDYSSTKKSKVPALMGAHMSFRRTALETIGGFDPKYRGNSLWEDVDCAFRLRASGYSIAYEPDARVKHLRKAKGGCRTSTGIRYVLCQFYNTSYFASRFAPPSCRASWIAFWWHRLEYISRAKLPGLKHDPLLVTAGICGAFLGIITYALSANRFKPSAYSSFNEWTTRGVNI